jgi:hypothetical protein
VAKVWLDARGVGVAQRAKTGRWLTTAPIFLLVPQVRLRKRLDLVRDAKATSLARSWQIDMQMEAKAYRSVTCFSLMANG